MPKCRTQNEARRDRNAMGLNILYVDQAEDCKHHQLEAVFSPLDCDSSSRLADIMCQGLKKVLFRSKNIVSGIAPPPTTCVSLLRPTCLFRAWHTFRNACVELESLKVETLEVRG